MTRRTFVATAALVLLQSLALASAQAQGVIKIGEVNSYKAQPAFLEPYKKGMELAVDEINAAGGLNGKKVELITRDDNGNPGDAVRAAEELVSREKVDVPLGHKDAAFVRSHFDAIEARIGDAPRANEIVVAVAVTDSGRPLPRIGGLQAHEAKGEDGLR